MPEPLTLEKTKLCLCDIVKRKTEDVNIKETSERYLEVVTEINLEENIFAFRDLNVFR